MNRAKRIYQIAKEYHEKELNCDCLCFLPSDVHYALQYLERYGIIPQDVEGTEVVTPWGRFGNMAWEHFLESFNHALKEYYKYSDLP